MVINLTTLTGKLARVDVEFMGQSCRVTYDPTRITQEWITKSQTGDDDSFIEAFAEVVKSWDVQRSGKKVPINKSGLTTVPLPLLKAVYMAVAFGDTPEIEEQGKGSSAG